MRKTGQLDKFLRETDFCVYYIYFYFFKGNKKPFVNSPSSAAQGKDKKLKYNQDVNEDDDEDYEPTGMLSEFQREAGLAEKSASKSMMNNKSSRSMINKTENSYMHQSLVASFMEQEENLSLFGKKPDNNKSLGVNPMVNLELSRAGLADVTRPPQLGMYRAWNSLIA